MKYSIIAMLFLIVTAGNAQVSADTKTDDKQFIPTMGYFGIGMNITGLINNIGVSASVDPIGADIILGKYYINDKAVFRTGLGINSLNFKNNATDSLGSSQVNSDSTFSQTALYLSPGVEFHFLDDKRLDPYVGAVLSLGLIGKSKYNTKVSTIDTTGEDVTEQNFQSAGGFSFGGTAVVGFNYFIARNFALGAEYHFGVFHNRVGGDWELVTINTPVSGTSVNKRTTGSNRTATTSVKLSQQLNITLSYFFNGKG